MLWGDRVLNIEGSMTFQDKENKLKAVIFFHHSKYDKFIGKIFHYKPDPALQKKEPTKLSEIKDIDNEVCSLSGSWLENLTIGDEEFWNI